MAEVQIDVQTATFNGLNATYTTDSVLNGSDTFQFTNDGRTFVHMKNGDSSSHTVTLTTPREVVGLSVVDPTVSIPAGEDRFIGPFSPGVFNAGGMVDFTLDAGTSMEVAVIRIK